LLILKISRRMDKKERRSEEAKKDKKVLLTLRKEN
jgi:hypothetical protein